MTKQPQGLLSMVKGLIEMELKRVSVGGEQNPEYSLLNISVRFKDPISHEFADFMQGFMYKNGVRGHISPEYEVSKVYGEENENLLLIIFAAGPTEYQYFEEYFEGYEFEQFMKTAINRFDLLFEDRFKEFIRTGDNLIEAIKTGDNCDELIRWLETKAQKVREFRDGKFNQKLPVSTPIPKNQAKLPEA